MSNGWHRSYAGELRKLVGHRKLIVPSIRAIIRDEAGRMLFIRRKGSGLWALPAGAIELEESIEGCLKREVKEETGLDVHRATLIAMYTQPRFSIVNAYGDAYQGFECLFVADEWSGSLSRKTDETTDAAFYEPTRLPQLEPGYRASHHREVMDDLARFRGVPFIK